MTVHGLRIYHSELLRVFHPAAPAWRGHVFANDFGVTLNAEGNVEDPSPALRVQYGSALLAADVKSQFALLRGDEFRAMTKSCGW